MARSSRGTRSIETGAEYGPDTIETVIRERVKRTIEMVVEQELEASLGAGRSNRVGDKRHGYRHGRRSRTLATSTGTTTIDMPRGRMWQSDGSTREWTSRTIPRYQRRTERVDQAILGSYLGGINTRRIRGALAPLLRDTPICKDAVSRLVSRLKDDFAAWQSRDLSGEDVRYLILDGWYPRMRLAGSRHRVPVLVALGVFGDGHKEILDLRLAGNESTQAWRQVVQGLAHRGLKTPELAVVDGSVGLRGALERQWPTMPVQRCTAHKLRNLESLLPKALKEELAENYRRVIYADSATESARLRRGFVARWSKVHQGVVRSLEEAGDELFTFQRFPRSQWKSLRTTNALERVNGEFRRRTKTQASLPSEQAVLLLLFGLLKTGYVRMRRINGWRDMRPRIEEQEAA